MHIYLLALLFFSLCKTAEPPKNPGKTNFYEQFMYGGKDEEAFKLKIFTEQLSTQEKQELINNIKDERFKLLKESVQLQKKKNDLEKNSDTQERIFRAVKWASIANIIMYAPNIVDAIEHQNFDAINEGVKEGRAAGLAVILLFGFVGYCIKTSLDEKKDVVYDEINSNLRSDFAAFIAQRRLEDKDTFIDIFGRQQDIYDAIMAPHIFAFEFAMEFPQNYSHVIESTGYKPFHPNDPSTEK